MEKSRDAVSIANLRAAYAEAAADYLTEGKSGNQDIKKNVDLKGKKTDEFSGLGAELPFDLDATLTAKDGTAAPVEVTFSYDETNNKWTAKVGA